MVTKILEELKTSPAGVDVREAAYEENGYHLTVEAQKGNIADVAGFFKARVFYLEDMCCVDYVDYLELVYFFNKYTDLCRVKVVLKVEADKPVAPTISHIYTIAHWYEREIHEFFGVYFEGHPKLTYLFLHDGIDHYPLRKKQVPVLRDDKKLLNSFKPEEEEDSFFCKSGSSAPEYPRSSQGCGENGWRVCPQC